MLLASYALILSILLHDLTNESILFKYTSCHRRNPPSLFVPLCLFLFPFYRLFVWSLIYFLDFIKFLEAIPQIIAS